MKRRVVVIIAMLVTLLTISAEAVGLRAIGGMPRLTFNGTTAHCVVVCNGDKNTDEVKATLTLYQGSTYVDSWSASGKGKAYISEDCAVKSGKSYVLKLTYSINGVSEPSASVTATCPLRRAKTGRHIQTQGDVSPWDKS